MDKKLKMGLVGCGKISINHVNALLELKNKFDLLCVCDKHTDSAKLLAERLGIDYYTNLTDMLDSPHALDLITLCSPSGLHAAQTIQIANKGIHVITEKPMATRWADGINMVKACDDNNVRLFVVKQNRYQPALQLIKQAVQKNRFGRLYLVNLNVFWTRPQAYYDQAQWRGTWEFDGGAFMNQASHYIDLLDWLIGPVQSIQAMMSTLAINMQAEDTGVLNIRWRSGTLGSVNVTMLTYPQNLEASLTLLGEKGSVKLGGLSADRIDHWAFSYPDEQDEHAHNLVKSPIKLTSHTGHKTYYENVASTLLDKAEADTDGRAGLRTLEILVAANLAARDNTTINLPLIL